MGTLSSAGRISIQTNKTDERQNIKPKKYAIRIEYSGKTFLSSFFENLQKSTNSAKFSISARFLQKVLILQKSTDFPKIDKNSEFDYKSSFLSFSSVTGRDLIKGDSDDDDHNDGSSKKRKRKTAANHSDVKKE